MSLPMPNASLRRFTLAVLGYTMFVVLWGAFVRASFSGDGCGDHWPLCHGVVLPEAASRGTLIELTHRVTSGLALIFAIALPLWARRETPTGHPLRRASVWVFVLMVTEALVGAAIVVLRKVATDTSVARGYWMAAHLLNTFLLLFACTAAVYFVRGGADAFGRAKRPGSRDGRGALLAGFAALLLVGMTGAITALGDMLFPAESFTAGFIQDFQPGAHPFLRLRVFHPLFAIAAAALLAVHASSELGEPGRHRPAMLVLVLVVAQVVLGAVNVLLMAPVWIQLVHLALADAVWMAWSWLALTTWYPLRSSALHGADAALGLTATPPTAP